jgi:hypothetical protein
MTNLDKDRIYPYQQELQLFNLISNHAKIAFCKVCLQNTQDKKICFFKEKMPESTKFFQLEASTLINQR